MHCGLEPDNKAASNILVDIKNRIHKVRQWMSGLPPPNTAHPYSQHSDAARCTVPRTPRTFTATGQRIKGIHRFAYLLSTQAEARTKNVEHH
jgi:hypothetical protein